MAIRAVLARRLCNDQRTAVLETTILPIKLSAHMVGQAGVDPATPGGNGFMTLETRIELETYMFENLDYSLWVQYVK